MVAIHVIERELSQRASYKRKLRGSPRHLHLCLCCVLACVCVSECVCVARVKVVRSNLSSARFTGSPERRSEVRERELMGAKFSAPSRVFGSNCGQRTRLAHTQDTLRKRKHFAFMTHVPCMSCSFSLHSRGKGVSVVSNSLNSLPTWTSMESEVSEVSVASAAISRPAERRGR